MGTRHLIMAVIDGQTKIAQYGQWDGYPTGQGQTVIEFLKSLEPAGQLAKFKAALRNCSWLSDEQLADLGPKWKETHGHLSRDHGADILGIVLQAGGLALKDDSAFAGESLFCEFVYVLDFDSMELEFYKGFNKESVEVGERFANTPCVHSEYKQVRLVGKYSMASPPTVVELCKDCGMDDEDEG